MVQMLYPILQPVPLRASVSDDPADILQFAVDESRSGSVAIATLVEIRGGAARALGSHVAVASNGRFSGYVSGGCVEAAVAAEALLAIDAGSDRLVKFGEGSPFFDIVLPCGGGITVAVHVLRDARPLEMVLGLLAERKPAGLVYSHNRQTLEAQPPSKPSWNGDNFQTVYLPKTRLIISGQSGEAEAVARLARASSYDVRQLLPHSAGLNVSDMIDPFTAVTLLHHDIEAEAVALEAALRTDAFYIGALGSTRTHRRRVERLKEKGFQAIDIDRIKAPIGMFGPTRDATSLALSVVADVAAARLVAF